MSIFNNSFRQYIQDELNFRKTREGRQQVYHPTARVTALVQGNLNGQELKGFTLGIPDVNLVNSIDDMTNNSILDNASIVGITYINNTPTKVTVRTKRNLPSPGVTNITISTQSKGGYTFKATINFKFYGKEQYDFIYQTFMRPGNPILIEYGHTRTDQSVSEFNDLGFFKDLTDTSAFENDIRQVNRLQATRSNGRVAGLVSNFKISLNEANEYEASIDVINALEFFQTLPIEDTVLSFNDNLLSDSIKNNFGYQTDEEYNPSYDRIYQLVLDDKTPDSKYSRHILDSNDVSPSVIAPKPVETATEAARSADPSGPGDFQALDELREEKRIERNPNLIFAVDHTWVSLNYVLNRLVPHILKSSIVCKNGSYQTLVGTPAQIQDYSEQPDFIANLLSRNTVEKRLRNASQQAFQNLEENNQFTFIFEPIGKRDILRSVNIRDIIINNKKLYDNSIREQRQNDYKEKFALDGDDVQTQLPLLFGINNTWKDKEQYNLSQNLTIEDAAALRAALSGIPGTDSATTAAVTIAINPMEENKTENRGIFVNYQQVRKTFMESSSLGEAITRLLNLVNKNTNDILKLKMRNISFDTSGPEARSYAEQFKIVIYDENVLPKKEEILDIYEFSQDDISEAISYNFDFSLPSAVSSTILASTFRPNESSIHGNPQQYQLIYNGYNQNIVSMLNNSVSTTQDNSCYVEGKPISTNDIFARNPYRRNYEVNTTRTNETSEEELRNLNDSLDGFYRKVIGYQELFPNRMKANAIQNGLFDTLPTSAKVSIKLNGLDGFRFGDMFSVKNMLPSPYDENNIFMLTGYKHDINSDSWITTIDGIMIASTPENKKPLQSQESQENEATSSTPSFEPGFQNYLIPEADLNKLSNTLREIVTEVKARLPNDLVMVVISTTRTYEENLRVKGAPDSRHLTGHAVDIQLFKKTLPPVVQYKILYKPKFITASSNYEKTQQAAYVTAAKLFRDVASERGVALRWGAGQSWGGNFADERHDANHFDIPITFP